MQAVLYRKAGSLTKHVKEGETSCHMRLWRNGRLHVKVQYDDATQLLCHTHYTINPSRVADHSYFAPTLSDKFIKDSTHSRSCIFPQALRLLLVLCDRINSSFPHA